MPTSPQFLTDPAGADGPDSEALDQLEPHSADVGGSGIGGSGCHCPVGIWFLDTPGVGNGAATSWRWAAARSGGSRAVGASAVDLLAGDLVRIQQPRALGLHEGRGRCCTL
jgi:hypothetical protein